MSVSTDVRLAFPRGNSVRGPGRMRDQSSSSDAFFTNCMFMRVESLQCSQSHGLTVIFTFLAPADASACRPTARNFRRGSRRRSSARGHQEENRRIRPHALPVLSAGETTGRLSVARPFAELTEVFPVRQSLFGARPLASVPSLETSSSMCCRY